MRPPGQIKQQVRIYLERHGQGTADQVAKFIGHSISCARKYLYALCEEKLVHSVDGPRLANGSRNRVFVKGPALGAGFDVRPIVKTWAPMRIVDPWMLPRAFFQPVGAGA